MRWGTYSDQNENGDKMTLTQVSIAHALGNLFRPGELANVSGP